MDHVISPATLGYLIIAWTLCFLFFAALFAHEKKKYPMRTCKTCDYSDNFTVVVVDGEPICPTCRHKH